MCEIIIERIQDKNPHNNTGETPLHLAAMEGHVKIVKLFLENLKHKNPPDYTWTTPFHQAAMRGHVEIVKLFLDNVEDKNPNNEDMETPLQMATKNGHLAVCQEIIDNLETKEKHRYYATESIADDHESNSSTAAVFAKYYHNCVSASDIKHRPVNLYF